MCSARSEAMELYRLTIPKDDAWRVIESLGNLDLAHFIDLNKNENAFSLPYATRVKLCDETERRIQYLIQKCKDNKINVAWCNSPGQLKQGDYVALSKCGGNKDEKVVVSIVSTESWVKYLT